MLSDRSDLIEFAATAAKEITVAQLPDKESYPCKKSGKLIAEYYSEIFNGILETLKAAVNAATNENS